MGGLCAEVDMAYNASALNILYRLSKFDLCTGLVTSYWSDYVAQNQ